MRERLRQEDGIALVLALACCLALSTLVFGITTYVTSNQRSASNSSNASTAQSYAEAALNMAYGRLYFSKSSTGQLKGLSPTTPTLLGCTASATTAGASDCTSPTPLCVGISGTCPTGTYSATAGTASVYGFFTGTDPPAGATFLGVTEQADEWVLLATGYTRGANGSLTARTLKASVLVTGGGHGAVASVWNHVFLTMPAPNSTTCTQTIDGNGTTWTAPLYVIGNLCISGQNTTIQETTQPVDLQVGGKLILSGSGSSAGTSTKSLTSGVVVGGCNTTGVANAGTTCNSSTNYYVSGVDTFVSTSAPEQLASDVANDYASFDPGPNHHCATGGLANSVFDNDTTQNGTNASFELLPNASYTCISTSSGGASTGQLTWNNSTKTLTVNGAIFLDGPMTIGQSGTYTGTGVIEVAGSITFNGNATQLCAENPCNTSASAWQGTSGNNSMLTLVALQSNNSSAIQFTNNSQTFQGSMWTQPSSGMSFVKNGVTVEGPMSIGSFDASFNNATFIPLPVIKNMPVGAPLPPNTGASLSAMTITK